MQPQPWQEKLFEKFKDADACGRFVISHGRGAGKSAVYRYQKIWREIFHSSALFVRLEGPVLVDGEPWYTINCDSTVAAWIQNQDPRHWHPHKGTAAFDVSEKLYVIMGLKWQ